MKDMFNENNKKIKKGKLQNKRRKERDDKGENKKYL